MNTLLIRNFSMLLIIAAIYATEIHAQTIVDRFPQKIKTTIEANGEISFKFSGNLFEKMTIRQTKGGAFGYVLKRGNNFLSSGHSTGFKLSVKSDGRSTYSLTILNRKDQARSIALSFVNDGTEP